MMKLIPLLFQSQFVIIGFVQAILIKRPEIIKFSVKSERDEEIPVTLVPTETFLANRNLPVWIPNPHDSTKLTLLRDIMIHLTPFTVYRDLNNCAAALYHHKKSQLDGNIGHHHIIRNLKYNSITKSVEPTEKTVFLSPLKKHNENRIAENVDVTIETGENHVRELHKSLRKYPDTVFIETLVMIDYRTAQELQFDYISIVSYVLSVFNSVDMIFSKIEIPNIKINIAGIIIANTAQSFPELIVKSCYKRRATNLRVVEMDAGCASGAIKLILQNYHAVPLQSYDIVVFLTRYPLFFMEPITDENGILSWKKVPLSGVAFMPSSLDGYKLSSEDLRVAIVSHFDVFEHLPIIAHEIAHLLGVPHDEGPLWAEDGTCDAHLMKKDNSYCSKCFKFGGTTQRFLKKFFGSRDACIFHNKPRSLNNPLSPYLFWNEDEQCECYGYAAAYKPLNTFRSSIEQWFRSAVDCKTRLKCLDENGEVDDTSIYMDGTPCDRNKIGNQVCWNTECSTTKKDHPCP